jgi:hypothetical protein
MLVASNRTGGGGEGVDLLKMPWIIRNEFRKHVFPVHILVGRIWPSFVCGSSQIF